MGFPPKVKEDALIACGRSCCICHRFCGLKIELHHIKWESNGGTNDFENAIPLCFDCHADMRSYDANHPKGTKYTEAELIRHRDAWYQKVSNTTGFARTDELVETDKKVYEHLIELLPWNNSMIFIRQLDFASSFKFERTKDFSDFQWECQHNPSFEFIDTDLESLRLRLKDYIDKFMLLLGTVTFDGERHNHRVSHKLRDEEPQRYWSIVDELNDYADNNL